MRVRWRSHSRGPNDYLQRAQERLACLVDPDRPCCGILPTNPAGQYVRKDATVVMVNTGFSTRCAFDHLRRQSLPEHVWELDHEQPPYGLIVFFRPLYRSIDCACLAQRINARATARIGSPDKSSCDSGLEECGTSPTSMVDSWLHSLGNGLLSPE